MSIIFNAFLPNLELRWVFFFIFDINFSYSSNKDKNYISTSSSGNQCPLAGLEPETADENEARLCRGR